MINFYLYDSDSGKVLATGAYDERGDGAANRALKLGVINADTEYAPAGVKTARPTFAGLAIDKSSIVANATDAATVTGIPAGTTARVYKESETFPRNVSVINDGTLVLRVDSQGAYRITLDNFPTQTASFTVNAT